MAKVIGISFCVLMCSLIVREHNKTFALALSIAGGVLSFLAISDKAAELFAELMKLSSFAPSGVAYVKLMLKVLCIVIITQFSVDICRDNGENALASFTEISAKILVLSLVMPLFETVISVVTGLVK